MATEDPRRGGHLSKDPKKREWTMKLSGGTEFHMGEGKGHCSCLESPLQMDCGGQAGAYPGIRAEGWWGK